MFSIAENIEPTCKSHAGFGQKWKIPQCFLKDRIDPDEICEYVVPLTMFFQFKSLGDLGKSNSALRKKGKNFEFLILSRHIIKSYEYKYCATNADK